MAATIAVKTPPSLLAPSSLTHSDDKSKRRDVATSINYYRDPGDGSPPLPIRISDKTVKNERPTIAQETRIHDITGEEDQYTLDVHGFQLARRATALQPSSFHDAARVERDYYPETEQLLRDITGASRVRIFDHKTRVGPANWHKLGEGNRAARGPLFRAHVDQSYAGAALLLRAQLPADEADGLLLSGRRWQIVNVWRPLRTVRKDPLAVSDARTIPDTDLLPASIIYASGKRDETWTMLPNAQHRWFYKNGQRPDEALLIKCFDSSDQQGVARRAPHSAFVDPEMEEEDARQSIETRALLFYDE
ncbi:hypothetical protein F5Y15DRAFT_419494 [Xylariaceae sp. FL0016]|nr:hypothetical protein F5Y15DRAFT_419494 [Xylariaceae sp. FL0016]